MSCHIGSKSMVFLWCAISSGFSNYLSFWISFHNMDRYICLFSFVSSSKENLSICWLYPGLWFVWIFLATYYLWHLPNDFGLTYQIHCRYVNFGHLDRISFHVLSNWDFLQILLCRWMLLFFVSSVMSFQIPSLCKFLVTHGAAEWFLLCVYSPMDL